MGLVHIILVLLILGGVGMLVARYAPIEPWAKYTINGILFVFGVLYTLQGFGIHTGFNLPHL